VHQRDSLRKHLTFVCKTDVGKFFSSHNPTAMANRAAAATGDPDKNTVYRRRRQAECRYCNAMVWDIKKHLIMSKVCEASESYNEFTATQMGLLLTTKKITSIVRECKSEFDGVLNKYPPNFQEKYGFPLQKLKDRLTNIQVRCRMGLVKRSFYKELEELGFDLTEKAKRKADDGGAADRAKGSGPNKKGRKGTPIVPGAATRRSVEEGSRRTVAATTPVREETKQEMEERHLDEILRVKDEKGAHISNLLLQIEALKRALADRQ
jgi:hypothetical protein